MPEIIVDGVSYSVQEGANLLHACLSQGLDLPYFCWHPSLGSVGACRQCAVVQYKDEADTQGKLVMSCMTPAADGSRLSIGAEEAVKFRALVIEWLMLNHPHDCPVCEEGGECHLQDMTVMTGHTARRYRGRKRTFHNQYLGPLLNHEMNRCITCYRCVRYYRDYAGGRDLDAFGSRDRIYFGRAEEGVLESEFAGNLVEVCPTGVFTDRPFSTSYTRKWDLTAAPSICHGCGVGCNTAPAERYGLLKRVHNRYHGEVNGYFLCDRGRFGAAFVNAEQRLRHPGGRLDDGSFDVLDGEEGVRRGAELVRHGRVAAIGSPRASLESNFALQQLVGERNFSPGFADHEAAVMDAIVAALATPGVVIPRLRDIESADAVLVLGEDVANTAPRLALALRQATRNESLARARTANIPLWQDAGVRGHAGDHLTPILQASVVPTRLDGLTTARLTALPEELADVGRAIAAAIAAAVVDAPERAAAGDGDTSASDPDGPHRDFVAEAVRLLGGAERPLIVSGAGCGSPAVVAGAAAVARALASQGKAVALALCVPECNSLGARLIGGVTSGELLARLRRGELDTLIVMENDLFRRHPPELLTAALEKTRVIALDVLEHATLECADLVLPAAPFAESDGTWISNEARAQRFYRVYRAKDDVAPSWRWLCRIAEAVGDERADVLGRICHEDGLLALLARRRPDLAEVVKAGPGAGAAIPAGMPVPRQPHRFSGRTAMYADLSVHEPKTAIDQESPLGFSMEGHRLDAPGALLPFVWAPGWNSNQSVYKFQAEVGGALRGGPAGVRLSIGPSAPLAAVAEDAGADSRAGSEADGAFRVVPLQDVFGSDELSNHAPAIRARAPAPFVCLSVEDAEALGVEPAGGVQVRRGEVTASFQARVDPALPPGVVAIPAGMTGALFVAPGERVELTVDPDYRAPPADRRSGGIIARG